MIKLIIDQYQDRLLDLKLIERYAGVVTPITKEIKNKKKTFPIASDVIAKQCWERGRFQELVPNNRYKSVAYWEVLSDATRSEAPKFGSQNYDQKVRFVSWLNFERMGLPKEIHEVTAYMAIKVVDAIKDHKVSLKEPIDILVTQAKETKIKHRASDVFANYSYKDEEFLYLWPYAFIGIDFDFKWSVSADCSFPPLMDPIICKNQID